MASLGFTLVWQAVTICAFLGGIVAYRRKRHDPELDPFVLITRYSVAGESTEAAARNNKTLDSSGGAG